MAAITLWTRNPVKLACCMLPLTPSFGINVDMRGQSYLFRRQPTFYRTLQPVGTVIIDKLQHFLYLVEPNGVALRYGIGIGRECADLIGLRHVASMVEWPSWEAPPDMVKQKLAQSSTLAG